MPVLSRVPVLLSSLLLVAASAPQDRNPLFPGADPDILAACGAWWLYPTGQGAVRREFTSRFFAWRSTDLQHWTRSEQPALVRDEIKWIPEDAAADHYLWAPGILAANGRYYMYYSVGPQNPTPSRIGVAVATRPAGPFKDIGKPLLTGGNGFEAIDPMVFRDPKSGRYFFYAGGSAGSKLRVFEMNTDLTSFKREVPVATPPEFTEGAFMHERGGTYYLSYSHGRFNGPSYSVHYATAPSPTGPWSYRGAILTSDEAHKGPGHHAFARDARGQWIIAYHRWDRPTSAEPYAGMRTVAIDRVRYDARGLIQPVRMTDAAPPKAQAPAGGC